ncbi:MAG: DUF6476 family protein [Alphaproteobacteria bacterium]
MQVLKVLVIVMGVLILVGVAVVAVTIYQRATRLGGDGTAGFASGVVTLPQGARVVGMTSEGDVLSLLVEAGDGRQVVLTIDRRSGRTLGSLELAPAQ